MLPVLVKPKILSAKNRWCSKKRSSYLTQDVLVLVFSSIVMLGLYNATLELLEKIHFGQRIAYLPPTMPLSLLLLFLFTLLIFSNGIATLSSLFLSKELDLVLSSPLKTHKFFFGKFTEIYSTSSWMAILFGLPSFIALGSFYDAPTLYYPAMLIALIPLFAIPSALALIAVTIFTTIIPAKRTRDFFFVAFATMIALGYFLFGNLYSSNAPAASSFQALFAMPSSVWLPSYWASVFIGELLTPSSGITSLVHLIAIFSVAGALVSLSFLLIKFLHSTAYSRSLSSTQQWGVRSSSLSKILRRYTSFLPYSYRAVALKDYKLFARDMTQAMQLVMLLGICLLYLYNFRALQGIETLPAHTTIWWQAFLLVANILMGSFVITAISARFVYPSLSLEGEAFWIFQTAPISARGIVIAKLFFWAVPIAIASCIIFTSGALSIQAPLFMVGFTALCSLILSFGIVSLAIGMGAHFINLHWEHTAQLTTGFGNLIFMLASTAAIFVNMLPITILIFVYTLRELDSKISDQTWFIFQLSIIALILLINLFIVRWSIRMARASLNNLRTS